jgi:para-aminobenzoate synthetase
MRRTFGRDSHVPKTIIIDNYDSFTYNLYQLCAVVSGTAPVVIRNDDHVGWRALRQERIGRIVISPGPGRPDRQADFGLSLAALTELDVPVLGVCLGHQGICHLAGAELKYAPEVMHGRCSLIHHTGRGLFEGIPSPFSGVRYHSLLVGETPPVLEPIAWADDGALMAVRHSLRPVWGVQFHPESICTEHGARIIENFMSLTREASRGSQPSTSLTVPPPTSSEHCASRDDTPRKPSFCRDPADEMVLTFHCRRLDLFVNPETVFKSLFGRSSKRFWLDSSALRPRTGRWSFMGDASGPLAEYVSYDVASGTVSVEQGSSRTSTVGPFLPFLNDRLRCRRLVSGDDAPFDFTCGYIGFLGYELKAECGGNAAHRADTPDAAFIFADRLIAFDHEQRAIWIACVTRDARPPRWLESMSVQIRGLSLSGGRFAHAPTPAPAGEQWMGWRHGRDEYLQLVAHCKSAIREGESYEICLTNMAEASIDIEPLATYSLLRRVNPAPFASFLELPGLAVLSSSPERFMRVRNDGFVEARPIKGTEHRGATVAEDKRLCDALQTSVKTRAENLMIVDLLRHDLGKVCTVGSVAVPELFAVESYATVHQLVSTITGKLAPGRSAVDCVQAAFPGGSMTGAPKRRTMEIIDQLEQGPRGIYSGALGYFALGGAADLSIVIRTIVSNRGRVRFGTGGAIIALSDAQQELEETMLKQRALSTVLAASARGPLSSETTPRSDAFASALLADSA